jgi:GNAT superfamily N-acetyltransferase
MTFTWEEINYDNMLDLHKVYKIYDETFPMEVREPHQVFLESLQNATARKPNNFRFLISKLGDEVVSFATGHYLAEVNTGFVVYIATNPKMRSRGVGNKTLFYMEELLKKDAFLTGKDSLSAIILETEKEEMAHSKLEKNECIQRNRFFQRNGFKLFKELEYIQPPLHMDENDIPLHLFIKVLRDVNLNLEEVKRIIQAIYREKYYLVNKIDKEVLNNCLNRMGIDYLP